MSSRSSDEREAPSRGSEARCDDIEPFELGPGDDTILLEVARRAIETQLAGDEQSQVDARDFGMLLRPLRATFVTLRRGGELRGCIGSLEPRLPLVESVWHEARQAAFADPRFPALQADELADLEIEISVLSPLEPLDVDSESELLDRLRPGVDGLVIEEGPRRATFLPSVWESLPRPADFLRELKQKAGLPPDYWSSQLAVWRYASHSF